MTDGELMSHALELVENKIGELSMRERAVARAAVEATLALSLFAQIDQRLEVAEARTEKLMQRYGLN